MSEIEIAKEIYKDKPVKWIVRVFLSGVVIYFLIFTFLDWKAGKRFSMFWGLYKSALPDTVEIIRRDTVHVPTAVFEELTQSQLPAHKKTIYPNLSNKPNIKPPAVSVSSSNQKGGQTAGEINNNYSSKKD